MMNPQARMRARRDVANYTERLRRSRKVQVGFLGTPAGVVPVPSWDGWVWVRLLGENRRLVRAVNNAHAPEITDLPVDVEWIETAGGGHYSVLGVSNTFLIPGSTAAEAIAAHASQHERDNFGAGGFDPLNVHTRMLTALRVRAQATPDDTVYVEAGPYEIDSVEYSWAGGSSGPITLPVGNPYVVTRRCDLVYLQADGLHVAAGVETTDGSVPAQVTTPVSSVPLADLYLNSTMTAITDASIFERRLTVGGIGSGVVTAHTLGSHSDSPADIANGFLKRSAANDDWEQVTYGSGANTVCEGDDARLADARTPLDHASTHEPGGGDAMAVDAVVATGSLRTLGTGAQQAAVGNHTHAGVVDPAPRIWMNC